MPGFDGELSELTPQKREEREKQKQKKREQDYWRGRKVFFLMLLFYVILHILSMVAGYFAAEKENRVGNYIFQCLIRVAMVVVLVRGLYLKREWARVFFAVLLVLSMLYGGKQIIKTAFVRYSSFTPEVYEVYEGDPWLDLGESIFDYMEKAAPKNQNQEREKARALYRRLIIAAYFTEIIINAVFLYILYGYPPAKIFFEGREDKMGLEGGIHEKLGRR